MKWRVASGCLEKVLEHFSCSKSSNKNSPTKISKPAGSGQTMLSKTSRDGRWSSMAEFKVRWRNRGKSTLLSPINIIRFKATYHISGIAKKISGTKRSKSRIAGYDNNFHEIVVYCVCNCRPCTPFYDHHGQYSYNFYWIKVKFADCTIAVWPYRIAASVNVRVAPWYHDPVFGSSVSWSIHISNPGFLGSVGLWGDVVFLEEQNQRTWNLIKSLVGASTNWLLGSKR